MNVSVEQLAPCKVLIKVEVDAATVDQAFEKATAEIQKKARITGFRPGKAPPYMIARAYGHEIESEARRKLLGESYGAVLKEHNIQPLSRPEVEEIQFGRGQPYSYAITLETEPRFDLPEYKGIPVEVEIREVTPEDVERGLQAIRDQRAEFRDVARPAAAGDFVVVHYSGTCEGKPITDHSPTARGLTEQKNFWLKMESDHFIPGFTDQLLGASAGDHRTVTITFPADFVVPVVAGKQGVYEVELVQVKERHLPELTDAFATQFGVDTLEALREGIRGDLENELKHKRVTSIRNQIIQTLLNRVQCELPEGIVEHETRSVVRDIVSRNQGRGLTKENLQEHKDEIFAAASTSARDRVKAALILNRIADREGIKIKQEEVLHAVALLAQRQNERPEKLFRAMQQDGRLSSLSEQLLTSRVLDFLQLQTLTSEVPARPQPPAP